MIEGFLCPSEVRREPLVHATCGTIGGVGGPGLAYPDVNVLTRCERIGGPTFGAVTSRSYHPGWCACAPL